MTSIIKTAFDNQTGHYILTMTAPSEDAIRLNVGPDAILVDGEYPIDAYFANGSVNIPEGRPGPENYWIFDPVEQEWFDGRTESEILAQHIARRNTATLSRIDFLIAAKNAGLISESDAEAAAESQIPPSMSPLFASLSPADQFEARIRWKAATIIERMNPLILQWASILGVTDQQLDVLFGIGI